MLLFEDFIEERVLSIGLNKAHEPHREKHRGEIHDILHKSYASIGGYGGHGSGTKEESDSIHHDISHSHIKATKRDGKLTTVNLYKDQHGRKSIASGTDGSEAGKKDFLNNKKEDHSQKRAWGEVSGKVEHLSKKLGFPVVHPKHAGKLLGKDVKPHEDGVHYTRKIGGHDHEKVIVGHPKADLD